MVLNHSIAETRCPVSDWDCHLVGHSAEDLRGMYPQSALAHECIFHERQAVVPTIPATIGTVLLDADACGLVLLSFPPSLMRMSMSVMAMLRQLRKLDT